MSTRHAPRLRSGALRGLLLAPLLSLAAADTLPAQGGYQQPPAPIRQILDAEPTPAVSVSPDRQWLLLLERRALPSIAEVAAPELHLAGDRLDPRTNAPSRENYVKALRLRGVTGSAERPIATPPDARIGAPQWAPDARRIAFTVAADTGTTLWVADVSTGQSRAVSATRLNAAAGAPCHWMDGTRLVCRTIPAGRGAAPAPDSVPTGPIVQESRGREAPNRTYQDLLRDEGDARLFDFYYTSQVAIVDVESGTVTPVGAPGVHMSAAPSPDGQYLLVETVHRPYSYVVPMNRFPQRTAVWSRSGVVVKEVADLGLLEEVPIARDAVHAGPRGVRWRADAPATLVWWQALDGGDPAAKVARHDRVHMLAAPFSGDATTLASLEYRAADVQWVRPDLALVSERWWSTRRTRTWAVDPRNPSAAARLLWDRSSEDRYGDPGRLVMTWSSAGTLVPLLSADGRSAYLTGAGASPTGDQPFLDRLDLATGRTTRLWRSEAPYYEEVVAVLDPAARRVVTRRESVTEVPNYWRRAVGGKELAQLTRFEDPAPQFAGVTQRLVQYRRADGVNLSARLYLPAGYDSTQGPLPFLFWAYPEEFKSAAAAAQVSGSSYRFVRPSGSSHLFLLTQGYGILDGPSMPIVGEGSQEPNDTYVEQLVASAKAAVEYVTSIGVADPQRIAVGGHSYGAFMTANLLAHSNLFRAGIARSGAYNRTLTPFGFQAEERPYWEARPVYERMSPFNYADSLKAPILLIHGMADDNSGTFPVQSERMFAALKGNGGTVRYVQLPAEAHGYRARESVGHTLYEMTAWLDEWVKRAPTTKAAME
ncbi:MAG TPA: prolyl oligopeptidase family serine peptidase [Gemmatimonadaceae bacterium]|nr:prolyl oligopeptidase family serine peptidase [Gemmatimonadaceae bacterium]